MKTYRIIEITDHDGNRRKDGRYPQRVNSLVRVDEEFLAGGFPLMWAYITDGEGNPKQGFVHTSQIQDIVSNGIGQIGVKTLNSIYHLRVEDEQ